MFYVKIPLAHLCEPSQLKVPENEQQATWDRRVEGLLKDMSRGVIPAWAVNYYDLQSLKVEREDKDEQAR